MVRGRQMMSSTALLISLLAWPALAHAQSAGIKGGFLYSSLKFSAASDVYDSRTGWTAGVFFGTDRDKPVGVMGEVNVQKRGGTDTFSFAAPDIDLYYIQVPVLLRVGGGGTVNVYGIVGPAFDFKVAESDNSGIGVVDEYEGIDVGITAGLGVEISRFIVEGRGNWGLRNIAKSLNNFDGGELKSRTFALQIGVRF